MVAEVGVGAAYEVGTERLGVVYVEQPEFGWQHQP